MLFEAVRHGDLAEDLALQHHERLTELKIRLLSDRVSRPHRMEDRTRARLGDDLRRGVPRRRQAAGRCPGHRQSCTGGKGKGSRSASALEALAAEQN
jgi:hypothetical protein